MDSALLSESIASDSVKWSITAGGYMFVCGVVTAFLLSDFLVLLADVIGLPATYAMVIFASPTLIFGAIAWWILIERRASYTYIIGALFGLVTALLTGMVWTIRFIDFWGVEMIVIPIVALLIVYVLGLAIVAGVLTGLPLMYARRRYSRVLAD